MISINTIGIVLIVAACTFFTRLLPFAMFGGKNQPPAFINYLGTILPSAVIAVLIIYCLKDINLVKVSSFFPYLIGIAVVVILHLWKRNNLLSIGFGTITHMILVQFIIK